jgi:hypothetical protein
MQPYRFGMTVNLLHMLLNLNSGTVFVQLVGQTANLLYGLLAADENKRIMVNLRVFNRSAPEEWVPYDFQQHGCIPLGNFYGGARGGDLLQLYEVDGVVQCEGSSINIKLPSAYPEIKMGRKDMDTKHGGAHDVILAQLADRMPENGDSYQYKLMLPPAILMEDALEHRREL